FVHIILLLLCCSSAFAQEKGEVSASVKDTSGNLIQNVTIYVSELREAYTTGDSGTFRVNLPANSTYTIELTHPNFLPVIKKVKVSEGEKLKLNLMMVPHILTVDVIKIEKEKASKGEIKINAKHLNNFVSAGGDATDIIKSLPGVSNNNELSSQYSVRGGNFDENLIYVNGIEIFRPLLVRAGEQEGLSFVNSDMVDNLNFYAGGFEARFGDKMSSVLDITYKKPDSAASSFNLSLLGVRAHTEGKFANKKGTYLMGFRQKSNAYLLNSTETQGTYKPNFLDFQTYVTYPINKKWEISFMGNIARNEFLSIPANRETRFGGINDAFQLKVFFEGKEDDIFESYFGAFSAEYKPSYRLKMKFNTSAFNTNEKVGFDILGAYALNSLENDLGSTDFGKVAFNLGAGSFLNHTRSQLNATIYNVEWNGEYKYEKGGWLWGLKYQIELIDASYKEWQNLDSAGYSLPNNGESLTFPVLIQAKNQLQTNRYMAFLQRNWALLTNKSGRELTLSTGVRANYWDYNQQVVVSPRVLLNYFPSHKASDSVKFSYRAYVGVYQQPPFYKELRNLEFQLQTGVVAQTSIQYGLAMTSSFFMWKRPFKLTTEAYYKDLYNLIPYDVDQVQINYYGANNSHGYARGIEGRLNGEFVKGLESWLSLTYMSTKEDITTNYYYRYFNSQGEEIHTGYTSNNIATDSLRVDPGLIARPTDQRFAANLFFQDEMPRVPALKLHLTLSYGTGYPFGVPGSVQFRNVLRIPDYRRVDIGFSYELVKDNQLRKGKSLVPIQPTSFLRFFEGLMFRAEVFNLLDIENTVSYFWVKDVSNTQYAVPNHLTSRLINFRILGRF
ncbi:MAG: TonB-dependent receptor, partial [Bacteroidetes bacterium]|nr:TonB-dependent receptor [Bacteroidota bacterium]